MWFKIPILKYEPAMSIIVFYIYFLAPPKGCDQDQNSLHQVRHTWKIMISSPLQPVKEMVAYTKEIKCKRWNKTSMNKYPELFCCLLLGGWFRQAVREEENATVYQGGNRGMNFGKLEEGSYHQKSLASVRDKTLGVVEKKKSRMIEERTRTEKLEN